jgi:hypothetical protein
MMTKERPWFALMVPPSWSSLTLRILLLTLPNFKMLRFVPYWIIVVLCLIFPISILQTFHASALECCKVRSIGKFAKYGCYVFETLNFKLEMGRWLWCF